MKKAERKEASKQKGKGKGRMKKVKQQNRKNEFKGRKEEK